jgi:hypothetical protein
MRTSESRVSQTDTLMGEVLMFRDEVFPDCKFEGHDYSAGGWMVLRTDGGKVVRG